VLYFAEVNATIDSIECSDCHELLDESYQPPNQKGCPRCGSLRRTIQVGAILSTMVGFHAKASWRTGDRKRGKPLRWGVTGDDLHSESGRWNKLERTFDRIMDLYYEHIVDGETGVVIRHCVEKLSEHIGRGSAKSLKRRG